MAVGDVDGEGDSVRTVVVLVDCEGISRFPKLCPGLQAFVKMSVMTLHAVCALAEQVIHAEKTR